MIALFWTVAGLLVFSYVGYGLLLIGLARLWPSRVIAETGGPLAATLLIAAHNEADTIEAKLDNALGLDTAEHTLEILVVTDGCADATAEVVRGYAERGVRLMEIKEHNGKMFALNQAMESISSDVTIFSDANSAFEPDAFRQLMRHFADPDVGGVCGCIVVPLKDRNWLGRSEALYWSYDHALKIAESRLAGAVSAQGSMYAIRSEFLAPIPPAVADDLIVSLRVVAGGKRLVFEPEARTQESVSGNVSREMSRRIRSTEHGWRGLMMMSGLLNPFRFGAYSLQLFSHKFLRRLTPFLLVILAVVTVILVPSHPFFGMLALLQAVFYGIAAVAWMVPAARRIPGFSIPLFFVMGHVAMGLGVTNAMCGRRTERWSPVRGD